MTSEPTGAPTVAAPAPRTLKTRARTAAPRNAYVWVWLPGAVEPVVAGLVAPVPRATLDNEAVLAFRYASSYLARADAISLHTPELPLTAATFDPRNVPGRDPLPLHGCLRDAAPDAWGRRVINARHAGTGTDLDELTYLLSSGSNRIGAIDYQASPVDYVTRDEDATLDELLHLAALVEAGEPVPASLAAAAQHGTSIGGARPKALLRDGERNLIAKFPSTDDTRPVVKAEAVAMLLAARAGLNVAPVEMLRTNDGREVLLVERFDRTPTPDGTGRRLMLSALTITGYAAMSSRYSSYAELAQNIRTGPWTNVAATLRELFGRLVLNIMVGNNDDHLRNHAAIWDGHRLTLTPAYDVAPQVRNTPVSSQSIAITTGGARASQLRLCRDVAGDFLLTRADADDIIESTRAVILENFDEVCDQALLTSTERAALMGREFLNPYIDYDEP